MFDGRLARLEEGVLTLSFSDASKLSGGHGFERANKPSFVVALADAMEPRDRAAPGDRAHRRPLSSAASSAQPRSAEAKMPTSPSWWPDAR